MLTGIPAWSRAVLSDPSFACARENGLAHLLRQWRQPALPMLAQELVDCMTEAQPAIRPMAKECLTFQWFEAMKNAPVPVHPKDTPESLLPGTLGGA